MSWHRKALICGVLAGRSRQTKPLLKQKHGAIRLAEIYQPEMLVADQ
jgi:hypothetical protein